MLDVSELELIHMLHTQGLTVTAIGRRLRRDRKTVRKYLKRGMAEVRAARRTPKPSKLAAFVDYLQQRVSEYPDLTTTRLLHELRAIGYSGSVTTVKERVRALRRQASREPPEIRVSQ